MARLIRLALASAAITLAHVCLAAAAAPAGLPLLHRASLQYAGSFRLPAPQGDRRTFDYGGTAPAYDPADNSLFVVGHDWYQLTAQVSIPSLLRARRVSGLRRGRYIQPFADATGGEIDETGGSNSKVGGQLVYDGKLYGSVYIYYDASNSQVSSHFARSSTGLHGGKVSGLFQLAAPDAGFVSGFMALVPPAWQGPLGGPALTGNCCIPIISRTSFGPAAFAFDPGRLGTHRVTPDHPLVYYPAQHHTLGAWDATWNPRRRILYGGATAIRGLVFPAGSRSLLFFGTQGVGKFCYGEGTPRRSLAFKPTPDGTIWCYDPDNSSKGTHAYPYVPEVWAYDALDLAAVRSGRRRPWQVRPYATWRLTLPFGSPWIGGVTYDPARGIVYVSQQYADGSAPVIDAFTVR